MNILRCDRCSMDSCREMGQNHVHQKALQLTVPYKKKPEDKGPDMIPAIKHMDLCDDCIDVILAATQGPVA